MKLLKRFWIYPLLIIGFAVLFYFNRNDWGKFTSQYKDATFNCRIDGEISNIKVVRGVGFIKLETGEGFLFYGAKNFHYKPSTFQDFICVGDSLFKSSDNDTVFVKRNQQKFIFVLNEYINE